MPIKKVKSYTRNGKMVRSYSANIKKGTRSQRLWNIREKKFKRGDYTWDLKLPAKDKRAIDIQDYVNTEKELGTGSRYNKADRKYFFSKKRQGAYGKPKHKSKDFSPADYGHKMAVE